MVNFYSIIYTILPKYNPLPVIQKNISSRIVDITFLGFLEAAAVAMFVVISKARAGFFNMFFAIIFDTLGPFLTKFWKKSETFCFYSIIRNSHRFFLYHKLNNIQMII